MRSVFSVISCCFVVLFVAACGGGGGGNGNSGSNTNTGSKAKFIQDAEDAFAKSDWKDETPAVISTTEEVKSIGDKFQSDYLNDVRTILQKLDIDKKSKMQTEHVREQYNGLDGFGSYLLEGELKYDDVNGGGSHEWKHTYSSYKSSLNLSKNGAYTSKGSLKFIGDSKAELTTEIKGGLSILFNDKPYKLVMDIKVHIVSQSVDGRLKNIITYNYEINDEKASDTIEVWDTILF